MRAEGVEHHVVAMFRYRLRNSVGGEDPDQGSVSTRESLARDQNIGFDRPMLIAEVGPSASEPRHDFVHD